MSRRIKIWLAFVVLALVLGGGYYGLTRGDLLATAKLVADNHDLGTNWGYVWRSNNQVEAFQFDKKYQCQAAYIVDANDGHRSLDTTVTNRLIKLSSQRVRADMTASGRIVFIDPPPAPELVLKSSTNVVYYWRGLAANGLGIGPWPQAAVIDDTHWILVHDIGTICEYITDLTDPRKTEASPMFTSYGNLQYQLLGSTPGHRLILGGWTDYGPVWNVDLVSVSMATPKVNPIHYRVKLPPRTSLRPVTPYRYWVDTNRQMQIFTYAPSVSPDGKHIAWPLAYNRPPDSRPPALRRLMTALHLHRPQPTACLWVSNLDGSHMRPVGFWGDGGHTEEIDQFRWLPDSKHISFRRSNGKLYVADVSGLLN